VQRRREFEFDPSTYGQAVSFGVSVAAVAPERECRGDVQFAVDGTNFGSASHAASGPATSGSINTLAEGRTR